jgi:hypothetical protein
MIRNLGIFAQSNVYVGPMSRAWRDIGPTIAIGLNRNTKDVKIDSIVCRGKTQILLRIGMNLMPTSPPEPRFPLLSVLDRLNRFTSFTFLN